MSQPTGALPGFWRFVWLFFMQPITLHRLLRSLDVDPEQSLWKLLRQRSPNENWWLVRSSQTLFLLTPGTAIAVGGLCFALGLPLDWARVAGGVAVGVAGGVAFGVAFCAAFLRLPLFVFEIIGQTAARYRNAISGRKSLRWAPVLYHELSYLPHPFLQSHILAEADADPGLARRVLEACSIAPGQRRSGRKVEAKLRARELRRLAEASEFRTIAELRGVWLSGIQGADVVL
ncbi:MAG: AAA family ATPase, partial [Bryobacteraceae bacterium]